MRSNLKGSMKALGAVQSRLCYYLAVAPAQGSFWSPGSMTRKLCSPLARTKIVSMWPRMLDIIWNLIITTGGVELKYETVKTAKGKEHALSLTKLHLCCAMPRPIYYRLSPGRFLRLKGDIRYAYRCRCCRNVRTILEASTHHRRKG
jgi:hypothetical protein